MDPVVAALALLVMFIGLVGVVVPVMPGLLLTWIASVSTTLWMGADEAGWAVTVVLTLLFAAGTAATVWLPTRRGRRGGAPASSLFAAVVGALIGFFVIPVLGLLVGAALGFTFAEFRRLGDWQPAITSLLAVLRAYGIGVVIELVLGVVMIAVWALAAILR